jgi:ubiquinone/menaquinone biosynthesis C-methylase UbiE
MASSALPRQIAVGVAFDHKIDSLLEAVAVSVYKYNQQIMDLLGFREQRIKLFFNIFPQGSYSILDVGGGNYFWDMVSQKYNRKLTVTILNRLLDGFGDNPNINYIQGDALALPFDCDSFDIVFSNSLIDHLYTFENQKIAASEIRRVGKGYFVQTINKKFIIEPHYWTPFIHYFSKRYQKKLIRNYSLWGIINRPDQELINQLVDEIIPSTEEEFKELFPDAQIIREKWCGLTKSFIAAKK